MDTKLLSKSDVCELLNISINTLNRIVNDGSLPVYRIRGQCRFMRSDIDAYLTGCRELHNIRTIPTSKPKRKADYDDSLPKFYVPGMKVV